MIPAPHSPDPGAPSPHILTVSSTSHSIGSSISSSGATRDSGEVNNGLLSPPANTGLSGSFVSDGGNSSVNSVGYLGLTPSSYSSTVVGSCSSAYWDCSDLVSLEESFRSERDGRGGGEVSSEFGSVGTLCELEEKEEDYKKDKERKRRSRKGRGEGEREEERRGRRVSFNHEIVLAQIDDEEFEVEEEEVEVEEEVQEQEVEVEKVEVEEEVEEKQEVEVQEEVEITEQTRLIESVEEAVTLESEEKEEEIEEAVSEVVPLVSEPEPGCSSALVGEVEEKKPFRGVLSCDTAGE